MSAAIPGQGSPASNRSVLLVDVNTRRRESRAASLRKLGAVVDCVSNVTAALQKFDVTPYQLVLIDLERDGAEQLASEIRSKQPMQLIGFMVEGPGLISKTLAAAPIPKKPVAVIPPDPPDGVASESSFGRAIRKAEESEPS